MLKEFSPQLADYPFRSVDKVRFADTDRQGHVNSANFSTFCETGRAEILYDPQQPLADEGAVFVIARFELDYQGEIHWPGVVEIGSRVSRIGTSSFDLEQVIVQDDVVMASARSVIVQINETSRRSHPLTADTRALLEASQREA